MTPTISIRIGSILALLAVMLGAFAAHAMKLDLHESSIWEVGVRYQMYHALALILLGSSTKLENTPYAAWFFAFGVLFFSGSLYAMILTHERFFGAVTPVGGVCFLIGWVLVIRQTWRAS